MADLKIIASHPVQYHVPFYQTLVKSGLDIEVGYYHLGTAGSKALDRDFGIEIEWDIDLLSGYDHRHFLPGKATYSRAEQVTVLLKVLRWTLQGGQTPLLLVGWFVELVWLVWLCRIILRKPVLLMAETNLLTKRQSSETCIRARLFRWLLQHTDSCLYIGSQNKEFYLWYGVEAKRLFPLPYSIDNERFARVSNQLRSNQKALRLHYGLDPDLPTFLFCGKLTPNKRTLELFQAYVDAGLDKVSQLVIIGDGQMRPELEHCIQEAAARHVHLLGFFNQSQMPLAYVLGDVLCLVSESETWGLVINEAFACSLPVIVTSTVGCAPDLVNHTNGWFVVMNNMQALSNTLSDAYSKRVEWTKMGERGNEQITQYHTYELMCEGVNSALKYLKSQR